MAEFEGWPKTARLNKEAFYTEKIDGTNAAILVEKVTPEEWDWASTGTANITERVEFEDGLYFISAQSRKRIIMPGDDNFGFAAYVKANSAGLIQALGEGRHFGEWWGHGIQRGYGLGRGERWFSLFNTRRWADHQADLWKVPQLALVPILYTGLFSTVTAQELVAGLRATGSVAAPGFDKPEGVCVFHTASNTVYKTFLENDDVPKGVAE